MKKICLSVLSVCLSAQLAFAVSVTIYNDDLALIKDIKEIKLANGIQKVEIDDVSSKIDATTVLPKFLSDAGKIKIYEQNFDYDLVNTNKLLQQYIGSDIEIEQMKNNKKEKMTTKLLAVSGGMVVQTNDKIILNPQGEVSLPKLPEGLKLKPTLSWLVDSSVAGNRSLELTYQTKGLSWLADYVVVLNNNDDKIDMKTWVTINNLSGTTYNNANLKLVAGDVNMVKNEIIQPRFMTAKTMSADSMTNEAFQEKSLFEYHMYELSRKTTIKNNEKKQIELISAQDISVIKKYSYKAFQNEDKIAVSLGFKNDKSSNLGLPLPKGKMRVYKNDGKSMEFIGEDKIDHTPANEMINLSLGNAFDITAERQQTDYRKYSTSSSQETISIVLNNSKSTDVEIEIEELLNKYSNWRILEVSEKYVKKDSKTIVFNVKIPAKSEKKVTYTVKYTW